MVWKIKKKLHNSAIVCNLGMTGINPQGLPGLPASSNTLRTASLPGTPLSIGTPVTPGIGMYTYQWFYM